MLSLSEAINELANELPAGSTLACKRVQTPKREPAYKRAPQTLYATMNELRSQLPPGRMTLEDAHELKRAHDDSAMAQKYVRALFGDDYERR